MKRGLRKSGVVLVTKQKRKFLQKRKTCALWKQSWALGFCLGNLANDSKDTPSVALDGGGLICVAGLEAAENPMHAPNTSTQAIPICKTFNVTHAVS